MAASNQPIRFVVTIDTEEEGLWSGDYAIDGTVNNIQGVPRFQQLCDQFGVRPTYLIDAPVVRSAEAVGILRPIQDEGRAEIGSHVHPWNNPPTTEQRNGRNSYLCNLASQLQYDKIGWLTDAIESAFEHRPQSFRAGRYGLDIVGAKALIKHGYLVDSSVIPMTDYSSGGGPDFREAPLAPYFVGDDDLREPCSSGELFEVPVTVGFTHSWFGFARWMRSIAMLPGLRHARMVGILDRLGIASRVKLSPEQATAEQMNRLARAWDLIGNPILVLMFHSSSLVPGYSPYVQSEQDLERFLKRIQTFFEYCFETLNAENATLRECHPSIDRRH